MVRAEPRVMRPVNPARAGMIPHSPGTGVKRNCKPRASGDDPFSTWSILTLIR